MDERQPQSDEREQPGHQDDDWERGGRQAPKPGPGHMPERNPQQPGGERMPDAPGVPRVRRLLTTLRDLYVVELRDLRSAEGAVEAAFAQMGQGASTVPLQGLLTQCVQQARRHIGALDAVLAETRPANRDDQSQGMQGIADAGSRLVQEHQASVALDAALIGVAQKAALYKMAGYDSARCFAGVLGDVETHRVLQECLNDEADADRWLTRLAEDLVNVRALAPER